MEIPADFEVVLPPVEPLDPVKEPGHAVDTLAATVAAGATIVSVGRALDSLSEYLEYLAALKELSSSVG